MCNVGGVSVDLTSQVDGDNITFFELEIGLIINLWRVANNDIINIDGNWLGNTFFSDLILVCVIESNFHLGVSEQTQFCNRVWLVLSKMVRIVDQLGQISQTGLGDLTSQSVFFQSGAVGDIIGCSECLNSFYRHKILAQPRVAPDLAKNGSRGVKNYIYSVMPLRLVLLGAPGSGKGTLTSRLLKQLPSLSSLSTGDILRSEIQKQSDVGKLADTYIRGGKLLPDRFMATLVEKELLDRDLLHKPFLLDGFPRTANQALELETSLKDKPINLVVELDVPADAIVGRITSRWMHSSGRVYNLEYNPPKVPFKDDVTGEPLFQRADDNPETVKKRLLTYYRELEPIKQFYKSRGVYQKVSGKTSDIIFPQLLTIVNNHAD
ncbi:hypothetical protein OGAPHI_002416 [Ogataea philodendri]|uniref:GTP:AMP phosphotransferase, mitochondrial n=1 Tax=Ogataea philodendri TaxID=1378263 RepID=A0A9P8PB84_9ASCO|nr:uncharacterized protein OGAPHI_002416 [Ogataea philodendri]KAH3668662.1 hypothetical protein OGAPHI_002416 [Ogataea philodendri]